MVLVLLPVLAGRPGPPVTGTGAVVPAGTVLAGGAVPVGNVVPITLCPLVPAGAPMVRGTTLPGVAGGWGADPQAAVPPAKLNIMATTPSTVGVRLERALAIFKSCRQLATSILSPVRLANVPAPAGRAPAAASLGGKRQKN